MNLVGMDVLVEQPRLPDARLSHDGDDLSMAVPRSVEGPMELRELRIPPDELAEPPSGRGLQARADRPGSGNLVRLNRDGEALDADLAERRDTDVTFGAPQCVRRDDDRTGQRRLLHPRRQM